MQEQEIDREISEAYLRMLKRTICVEKQLTIEDKMDLTEDAASGLLIDMGKIVEKYGRIGATHWINFSEVVKKFLYVQERLALQYAKEKYPEYKNL